MTTGADVSAYTVPQVAERIGVSERTVWRWVTSGGLPSVRLGTKLVRVLPHDLDAWLQHNRAGLIRR